MQSRTIDRIRWRNGRASRGRCTGQKPSTCLSIDVVSVVDSASQRTVQVSAPAVPSSTACGAEVTSPAHLVKVPRTALPVVFDLRS